MRSGLERRAEGVVDVFREQDEVESVGWGGLELGDEVEVEVAGGGRLGVDEERPAADLGAEWAVRVITSMRKAGADSLAFVVYRWTPSRASRATGWG